MKRALLMVLFATLLGCSPKSIELVPEAESIELIDQPSAYPQCLNIGEFRVMALDSRQQNSYQQALIRLKNQLVFSGGTHFKFKTVETNDLTTTITVAGYRCPLDENRQIRDMRLAPSA